MTPQHVMFPAETFLSQTEFDLFCSARQSLLDARFAYEQSLPAAARPGTCAPCLQTASFAPANLAENTSAPEKNAPDTNAPDWREGQLCDCPHRLGQRARAVLHFLQSRAGLGPTTRLLLFGPAGPLHARLAEGLHTVTHQPRLLPAPLRLDTASAAFTVVLSWDYLHRVPPLAEALAEIRRSLAPGGRFVFTVPFHYRAAGTRSRLAHVPRRAGRLPPEFRGEVHEIGWDILPMLDAAGFARSEAHGYWSDELGYLGAHNMLFSASA